jgi:hypothetical protein
MIIKAFSDYIKEFNSDIPTVILLFRWLKDKLMKQPENNVERVIHKEITLFMNKKSGFLLVSNSESGRILIESLYNFALSYEQQNFSRWIHNTKASDFRN